MNYGHHVCRFDYEKKTIAVFHAITESSRVIASACLEPWGLGEQTFLYRFHVDNEFRRMGHGRNLVNQIIGDCRIMGMPSIAMYVHKDNSTGIDFWESVGFKSYYKTDDDLLYAIRLEKQENKLPEDCDCKLCDGMGLVGLDGSACACVRAGCKMRHGVDNLIKN